MKNLENNVVLVCGGATGIGAATAQRLGEEGARVVIGDLNLEAAESTAQSIVESGSQAIALHYDQSDENSISALVEQTLEQFDQLNGVFANAADLGVVLEDGDVLSNDPRIWERTLSVNLVGTAQVIRATLPHLLAAGGGSIVCTSSTASTVGEPERPAYAASKAGINALCRHVCSRWGKEGIRCNAIAPGLILTPQLQETAPEQLLEKALRGVKSPRHGAPEDIAAAVAFLLSDEGAWVNGQTWHVNGGIYFGQ